MGLMNILKVSGSAMSAQDKRLNTIASNLANADSVSSSENTTYKARMPIFAAQMVDMREKMFGQDIDAVGVKVKGIVESQTPLKMEYQPDNPYANEDGYIFRTNVNPMDEMANLISSSRSYQMNVEVADTTKQLMMRTLNLGQ